MASTSCSGGLPLLAIATTFAVELTVPAQASAAPAFGGVGTVAISAEDLTGYYSRSIKFYSAEGRSIELTRNDFSFALANGGVRVGAHYFVIPSLSLGGFVGFASNSGSNTYQDNPGTWSIGVPTETHLVVAPRVGYALMFTPEVGLWFRGGLGYERHKARWNLEGREAYSRDSFGVASADVLFVWSPVAHFGLMVGPTADRSFLGSRYNHPGGDNPSWSSDARTWRLGLTLGLIGYF